MRIHFAAVSVSREPLENMCFFVRGDSIVEKEFVFCYCLFAVSIFGDSTAFGHHISLNPGSVYTPAVYYVKNMSVVVVLSKTNVFFFWLAVANHFYFHHVSSRSRCQQPRPGKWH